jgi:hypothetical protein
MCVDAHGDKIALMKSPNIEFVQKAFKLVVEAEKAWRDAWNQQIPAGRMETDAISSALSSARDLLQNLLQRR